MNIDDGGDPFNTMHHYDGWVDTAEDPAEFAGPAPASSFTSCLGPNHCSRSCDPRDAARR
jgi:hypothetical protein